MVARCDRGRTMVKLKSATYLALHRLRFSLTAKAIRQICIDRDVRQLQDFTDYLTENDADWELMADTRPLVETYLSAAGATDRAFDELKVAVAAARDMFPARKDFALSFAVPLGGARTHAAFAILDRRDDAAYNYLREAELDARFKNLEAADEQRLAELDG